MENCISEDDEPKGKRQRQSMPGENTSNEVMDSAPEISNVKHFMPLELMIEILKWLPVESLLRCKSVSKLWRATIQERSFINRHKGYSKQVEIYKEDRKSFIYEATVHGLVLEKSKSSAAYYQIWNPSTRQILRLPCPPDGECYILRIVYLPNIDKYKLAYVNYIVETQSVVCSVLTAGIDLEWRSIDIPSFTKLQGREKRCTATKNIVGVLFLFRYGYSEIVCIQLESECSTTVEIPQDLLSDWEHLRAFRWNNKFALARAEGEKLNFWVLEDYKKRKWAEKKQVISLEILRKHPNSSEFMRKYPNLRKLTYYDLKQDRLWIFADDENSISYDLRDGSVCIHTQPPGKKIYCYYTPSLVHIQGMQIE